MDDEYSGWDYGPGNIGDAGAWQDYTFSLGNEPSIFDSYLASIGSVGSDPLVFDDSSSAFLDDLLASSDLGVLTGGLSLGDSNFDYRKASSFVPGSLSDSLAMLSDEYQPSQSFKIGDLTVGLGSDADVQNPFEYRTADIFNGAGEKENQTFIFDKQGNRVIGYVDENSQPRYYVEDYAENTGHLPLSAMLGGTYVGTPTTVSGVYRPYDTGVLSTIAKSILGSQAKLENAKQGAGGSGNSVLSRLADIIKLAKAGTMTARALKGNTPVQRVARGSSAPVQWNYQGPRAVKLAEGGSVGGLGQASGSGRLVPGGSKGQDDTVNAKLSSGEYVFDAETVSALGDGNTEAGARELDKMRENVRKHKRGGSVKSIPPKAKSAEKYLKGAK